MYMCEGQKIADQLAWLVRRRRRRTFIETKYIRRETLAKVYKNRSREPCDQYMYNNNNVKALCKYFCDISVPSNHNTSAPR